MNTRIITSICWQIQLLFVLSGVSNAFARVVTVPADDASAVLQLAKPCDTLMLAPRTCNLAGMMLTANDVTIIGSPGTILQGNGKGRVLTIIGKNVTLQGITIQGSGKKIEHYDATLFLQGEDIVVEDCRFQDAGIGIAVNRSRRVTIQRCRFDAIVNGDERKTGNAIHAYLSSDLTIHANHFHGGMDGAYFDVCSNVIASNNVCDSIRYGIHFMNSSNVQANENSVKHGRAGIAAMYTRNGTIQKNDCSHNDQPNAYGILLQDFEDGTVVENKLTDNDHAFLLEAVRNGAILTNRLERNRIGFDLHGGCRDVWIMQNAFVDQLVLLQRHPSLGANPYSLRFHKNYYSDAVIPDAHGDGYGDVPYAVANPQAEALLRQPMLTLFRGTLAQAIIMPLLPTTAGAHSFQDRQPLRRMHGETKPTGLSSGTLLAIMTLLLFKAGAVTYAIVKVRQ